MKTPDWQEWKNRPLVCAWEACALSMGIDPRSLVHSLNNYAASPRQRPLFIDENVDDEKISNEFDLRLETLIKSLPDRSYLSPSHVDFGAPGNHGVRLPEFAYWAIMMEWDKLPCELLAMSEEVYQAYKSERERQDGAPLDNPFDTPLAENNSLDDERTPLDDLDITHTEFVDSVAELYCNGAIIQWDYWLSKMPVLTPAQASRLMSGLDPDIYENLENRPYDNDPSWLCKRAKYMQRLAETQKIDSLPPNEWLNWADENEFAVHEGFRLSLDSTHFQMESEACPSKTALGVAKNEIIKTPWPLQGGLNQEQFRTRLTDVPRWMKPARVHVGSPGKGSSLWNPALIGACLLDKGFANKKALTVFLEKYFPEWSPQWKQDQDIDEM